MVYIREAHPVDGWWFGGGIQEKIVKLQYPTVAMNVYDPKTIEERRKVAGQCQDFLKYGVITYVDEMDDRVNKAYAAWPTRLYLVGLEGSVEYAGGLGPFGFKPLDLKKAIDGYLAQIER
jgi:hypothetical protein